MGGYAKKYLTAVLILFLAAFSSGAEHDLTLDLENAVEYALENNVEVLSAREDIEAARAGLLGARAGFLPEIKAYGHYSYYKNHPTMPFENNAGYTIEIIQNILTGGRLTSTRRASLSEIEAAEWALRETENNVRFRVKKAFCEALLSAEVLRINEESLSLAEEMLESVRRRFEKGQASNYELLRQRVERQNMKTEAVKAENNLRHAENFLKTVIGAPAAASIVLEGSLEFSRLQTNAAQSAAYAVENRPALKEIDALLESAGFMVRSAKSGYFPSVFISAANISNKKEAFSPEFEEWENYWEARLSVSVPLFDSGLTSSRVNEAKSAERKLKHLKAQRGRNVAIEVNNALLKLDSAAERAASQKENTATAEEAYNIIRRLYASGEASRLDVTDAALALARARLNHTAALCDYAVAKAELELAAGGPVFENSNPGGEKDE
jgi:outer membrane protein